MRTKKIAEFNNGEAKIKVVRNIRTKNDLLKHKLYTVTEEPINKKATWTKEVKEFDYTYKWQKYFKKCVNFWL